MKRFFVLVFIAVLALFTSCSIRTVPYTGETYLESVSNEEILSLSAQQYREVIGKANLSKNKATVDTVKRVGRRLTDIIDKHYRDNKLEHYFKWEFNVVEDKQVNAFCMPGGKIVVYTGILPVCKDENGLAVVMGHEIAHALAEHGNQRVNQGRNWNTVLTLGTILLGLGEDTKEYAGTIGGLAGLGVQYGVVLPHSRDGESEADQIGLEIMARAGYDPRAAAPFWQRMAGGAGASTPEFMSTHPSPDNRAEALRRQVPKVIKFYEASQKASNKGL